MIPPPGPQKQFPDNFFSWLERHLFIGLALQVLAALVLGGITFFLWIVDAHHYAITTGVFTVCLIVSLFVKKDPRKKP